MGNKNVVSAQIVIDTKEAQENIKELTKATDECVAALGKLERVMSRFFTKSELKDIQVGILLDGTVTAESIIRKVNDIDEIRRSFK
ncbi:hypothetical protein RCJ96_26725 [Bacillus sp. BSL6]